VQADVMFMFSFDLLPLHRSSVNGPHISKTRNIRRRFRYHDLLCISLPWSIVYQFTM